MSEIKINIEDKHLFAFIEFLKTLNYVQIREVSAPRRANGKAQPSAQAFLDSLPPDDPLRMAVKPLRSTVTSDDLIREQHYQKTDWKKVKAIAQKMDIQEPVEDLLAQLTP
jgi:hypothetical protein